MRFVCIDDDVPELTVDLLRAACAERDVEFVLVQAGGFAFDLSVGLAAGDMLYCPAVSMRAARVEQFLAHEAVASFHARPLGAFFGLFNYPLYFQRLGLPAPRAVPLATTDRQGLKAAVAQVGGLPAVVKVLGGSGGVGVLRVDNLAALYSLADLLLSEGRAPFLMAYVAPATHWRVTVVGERAVAAYRNPTEADDFRTFGSEDPADFTAEPPSEMAALAVAAVKAIGVELGGVDILEHESGRLYLLEANFPCYFAQAQEVAGIDVAGAMLDHLVAKSRAILAGG